MTVKERDPFLWLAPDLADDGDVYREYSDRLIRDLKCYFASNGCRQADDLASEVLYRLVRKLGEGEVEGRDTETARRQYVFGIAKFVLKEWRRGPGQRELPLVDGGWPEHNLPPADLAHAQCLELLQQVVKGIFSRMSPMERDILSESELNPDYAPTLADLAKQKGTQPAAMRQRAHRARKSFRRLLLTSDRLGDLLRCWGLKSAAV